MPQVGNDSELTPIMSKVGIYLRTFEYRIYMPHEFPTILSMPVGWPRNFANVENRRNVLRISRVFFKFNFTSFSLNFGPTGWYADLDSFFIRKFSP